MKSHIMMSFSNQSQLYFPPDWTICLSRLQRQNSNLFFSYLKSVCATQKHLFPAHIPSATNSFRRSQAERCPFDDAEIFLMEAFKSDSRCSVVCPLDVANDTAISQHQDSHSLSFAVLRYMPSVDIAVLLQRRMSRRWLSVGCCRLCRMTVDIFQLLNDTKHVGNVLQMWFLFVHACNCINLLFFLIFIN